MTRPGPFRVAPLLPASAMKTFQVSSPIATHFRPATCAEVECEAYRHGWATMADESIEQGQRAAYYIRHDSGRRFTERRSELGITVFTFEAGQRCFGSDTHRVTLERPELFVIREGDWRGNPRGVEPEIVPRAADWVDRFADHQSKIVKAIEEG
jgi:hypothetical protein